MPFIYVIYMLTAISLCFVFPSLSVSPFGIRCLFACLFIAFAFRLSYRVCFSLLFGVPSSIRSRCQ
ncbi:hypothetical protein F5890DRAFT_209680 [Lentinula detonsa]|uniref:Uncharacterized protein n=1 Tax=Lentinula detonsa TaxID=2804962 RepID=A0AA38PMN4_9AGAR|nr:hypothetical protein F5890DRAFT_209680 [Lentinula detonsa]